MEINLFQSCSLFKDISENNMDKILFCLNAKKKQYKKQETVVSFGSKSSLFGVLLSGAIEIHQEDFQGNITIVAQISPGQLFGEAFACAAVPLPVTVQASESSTVLWLDYDRLLSPCQHVCDFHTAVIKNMMKILANKNIFLNARIGHLAKRTLREKVLSYLTEQSRRHGCDSFTIPFNRQKMADYLAADRSALSSVLSKLKSEGIIDFQKNKFTIRSKKSVYPKS